MSYSLDHNKRGSEKRTSGRMCQQYLMSNLGPVMDMSRGGLRILASKRLRGEVTIKLLASDGPLDVAGRVVWTQRMGFMRFEVGIAFDFIDADITRRLLDIARSYAPSLAA